MSSQSASAILNIERTRQKSNLSVMFQEIMEKSGGIGFLPEFLKLLFGPGKVSFDDYVAMRLWDRKFCPKSAVNAFVGNLALGKIVKTANFIVGSEALITNKIASNAIFDTYGLPTPPLSGLHILGIKPAHGRTATPEALEAFLLHDLAYPAFGKPLSGRQSLGSISFDSCDASSGTLICQDGRKITVKDFAQEVHTAYAKSGYVFQPRLVPHKDVRTICGERIATLRIITLADSTGIRVFRACWKIPAGSNMADNFWRPGNMLATIDLDEGTVYRVISGTGLAMREVEVHPDTQARMVDIKVPLWEELCATVCEGAAALSDFGLLGWDIAATATGPVIVEVNHTPDLVMLQLAARRGIMDPAFIKFLEDRRRAEIVWKNEFRETMKKEYAPSFINSPKQN